MYCVYLKNTPTKGSILYDSRSNINKEGKGSLIREDINQPEHPSLCPSPLCCSVNGRWDGISYGVLSVDDRYGLMHRQLQVLFRMSNYTNTTWTPCGGKVCRPQHKHAETTIVAQTMCAGSFSSAVFVEDSVKGDGVKLSSQVWQKLKLNTTSPNTLSVT